MQLKKANVHFCQKHHQVSNITYEYMIGCTGLSFILYHVKVRLFIRSAVHRHTFVKIYHYLHCNPLQLHLQTIGGSNIPKLYRYCQLKKKRKKRTKGDELIAQQSPVLTKILRERDVF